MNHRSTKAKGATSAAPAPAKQDKGIDANAYISALTAQRNSALDDFARLQAMFQSRVAELMAENAALKAAAK